MQCIEMRPGKVVKHPKTERLTGKYVGIKFHKEQQFLTCHNLTWGVYEFIKQEE